METEAAHGARTTTRGSAARNMTLRHSSLPRLARSSTPPRTRHGGCAPLSSARGEGPHAAFGDDRIPGGVRPPAEGARWLPGRLREIVAQDAFRRYLAPERLPSDSRARVDYRRPSPAARECPRKSRRALHHRSCALTRARRSRIGRSAGLSSASRESSGNPRVVPSTVTRQIGVAVSHSCSRVGNATHASTRPRDPSRERSAG